MLGVTIEAAIRNIEERRTGLHAAQLKAKEHTVRGTDIAERLGSIDREIAPFLAAADRTAEQLDADPEGVAARFIAVAKEYDILRKQVGELDLTLQRLAPDRAAAAASAEHARTQVTETAARLNQRRSVVDEKTVARAKLFDGEATASHRTRINEGRRIAREAARDSARGKIRRCRRVPGGLRPLRGSRLGVGGRNAAARFSRGGIQRGLSERYAVA